MATFIHGIGASENIDSSGEVVSIAGLDVSSLDKDGVFNYEHKSDLPAQVVGKILKVKKIFSDADCEDDHQKRFWEKVKVPYLYVMGELFDDYSDSAREVAGKFRYDADHRNTNERNVMNFSVEGSKISKTGIIVDRSIGRKITITVLACNKMAIAEMVAVEPPNPKKSEVDELFKTEEVEIEVFTPSADLWKLLKKEDPNKHANKLGIKPFQKDMAGGQASNGASTGLSGVGPTSAGGLMMGSEMAKAAQRHDPKIPGTKSPSVRQTREKGTMEQKGVHLPPLGTSAGGRSVMGSFVSDKDKYATRHAGHTLKELKGMPKPNLPKSEEMNKAANLSIAKDHQRGPQIGMTGSGKPVHSHGMIGDYHGFSAKDHSDASKLHQTMASKVSATDSKSGVHHSQKATLHLQASKSAGRKAAGIQKAEALAKAMTAGSGIAAPNRLEGGAALAPESMNGKVKGKSKTLQRAEMEYVSWTKREEFEVFMKSRLPSLTRSEIMVIGMAMLLNKSFKDEKMLKDFYNPATLKGSEKK